MSAEDAEVETEPMDERLIANWPQWREVDLGKEMSRWKRDACSQMESREPQQTLQSADDLLKAIIDILKGRGQLR